MNVAALAAVAAVGYLAMSPPLPYHEILAAGTWQEFGIAFSHNLAFPWVSRTRPSTPPSGLPLVALAVVVVVHRLQAGTAPSNGSSSAF